MKKSGLKTLKEYLIITLGTLLLTAGVYFFKIPNGFATGGVSGIGTLLGKAFPSFSPAMWIMTINILLLMSTITIVLPPRQVL